MTDDYSSPDFVTCEQCSKQILERNMLTHSLQCERRKKFTTQNQEHAECEIIDLTSSSRSEPSEYPPIMIFDDSDDDGWDEDKEGWCCEACTFKNGNGNANCTMCDTANPRQTAETATKWPCNQCTFENVLGNTICSMCGNSKSTRLNVRRRPIDSDDSDSESRFRHESRQFRNNISQLPTRPPFGFMNAAIDGALLGATIGAGVAWINGRSISRGVAEGASLGAAGGIIFSGLLSEETIFNENMIIDTLFGDYDSELEQIGGVSPSTLDQLPLRVFHSGRDKIDQCSICIESFKTGEDVRTLPCLHQFHQCCVDHWLTSKNTCPICKHQII